MFSEELKVMFIMGNVQNKNNLYPIFLSDLYHNKCFLVVLKKEQTSLADSNIFLILLFLTSFSKKIE